MNPLALFSLAAAFALGSSSALAQDRYSRDGGARNPDSQRSSRDGGYRSGTRDGAYRGGTRDGGYRSGGYRDGGHYDHRWARPHYYSRYYPRTFYYPFIYPAPLFGYYEPYPIYAAAPQPLYVERYRVYEDEPPAPPPRAREYREPSYAQAEPARPTPPPAPAAPRLERYTLSAQELFEFDKSELRRPQPKLDEIARAMAQDERIDNVLVTGYTDRLGSDAYNLALSQRRADAVKKYFVDKGIAPNRLKAIGKGKSNPVVQCNDRDRAQLIRCLEPNRRVEVESITIERRVPALAPAR